MKTDIHFGLIQRNSSQNEKCFGRKVVQEIRPHFVFKTFFSFFFENRALCGIILKNIYIVQPDRPQMTIWLMRIACWIPKATNTFRIYIKLSASPRQQWLCERTSVLRYTYIALLYQSVIKLTAYYTVSIGNQLPINTVSYTIKLYSLQEFIFRCLNTLHTEVLITPSTS